MPEYDGSIVINAKIDTKEFKKDAEEIINYTENLKTQLEKINYANSKVSLSLSQKANFLINDIRSIQSKMESLSKVNLNGIALQKINENISQASKLSEMWRKNIDELKESASKGEVSVEDLEKKNEVYNSGLKKQEKILKSLLIKREELNKLEPKMGSTTREYDKLCKQLESATQRLDNFNNTVRDKLESGKPVVGINKLSDSIKNVIPISKKAFSIISNSFKNVSKAVFNFNKVVFSKVMGIMLGIKPMASLIDKIGSSLSRIIKIVKYQMLKRSIGFAIKAVQDGISNLSQYSEQFNITISSVVSGFSQLKNSIITAVSPIITYFAPAINYLTSCLSKLFNMLSGVTSRLFLNTRTVTVASKPFINFAKSMDKSNKSAKSLKSVLAAFDRIDVLKIDKGARQDAVSVGPENMFQTVQIPKEQLEFADKLKDKFKLVRESLHELNEALNPLRTFTGKLLIVFYERFLKPVGEYILGENGLPRLNRVLAQMFANTNYEPLLNALTDLLKVLDEFTTELIDGFITFVQDGIVPLYKIAVEKWLPAIIQSIKNIIKALKIVAKNLWLILTDFLNKFVTPVGTWLFTEILPKITKTILEFVNSIDWDKLRENLGKFWDALTKFTKNTGDALMKIIEGPLKKLGEYVVNESLNKWIAALSEAMDFLGEVIDKISPALEFICKIFNFLAQITLDDFNRNLQQFTETLKRLKTELKEAFEPFDKLKESKPNERMFLGFTNLFKRKFSSPSRNFFGIKIPGFATGSVVPPNNRFLAMLGDNTTETEVVSPLSTIRQAVIEAIGQGGYGNNRDVVLQLDGTTFARLIAPYTSSENARLGVDMVGGLS